MMNRENLGRKLFYTIIRKYHVISGSPSARLVGCPSIHLFTLQSTYSIHPLVS